MKKLRLKNEKLQRFVDKYFNTNDKKFGRNVAIAAALLIGLLGGLIWTAKTIVTNSKKNTSVIEENNYYLTETSTETSPIAPGDYDVYADLESYQLEKNMSDTTVDDITQEVLNNIDRNGYTISEEVKKEMYSEITKILSQELSNRDFTAADLSDDIWKRIEDRVVEVYKRNQADLDFDKNLEETFRKLIATDLDNLNSRIKNSDSNIANNSNKIADSNKKIDEQGQLIDKNGKLINEQGQLIDKNGKLINEQGQLIDKNGKLINEQGQLIDKNGNRIDEQGKLINDTNSKLADTNSKLNDTNSKLNDTNSKLDDTNAKLGNTDAALADTNKKVDGINSALADATSDYTKKIGDLNSSFEDKMKALSDQLNALNTTVTNNYDTLSGQINSALGNYAAVTYDSAGNPYIWVDNNHNGIADWTGGADTLLPFKRKVYSKDVTHYHFGNGGWTCEAKQITHVTGGYEWVDGYEFDCPRAVGEPVGRIEIYMWPNGDGTYTIKFKSTTAKWRLYGWFEPVGENKNIGFGDYDAGRTYIVTPGEEFKMKVNEFTYPNGPDAPVRLYSYANYARVRIEEGYITVLEQK